MNSVALLVAGTLLALVTACTAETTRRDVAVSPADVRAAVPRIEARGKATLRDRDGARHDVDRATVTTIQPNPAGGDALRTNLGAVADACSAARNDGTPNGCEPSDARARVSIETTTTYYRPTEAAILVPLAVLLDGGVIAGEAYCFAQCGTAAKVALATVDVFAVGAAIVVLSAAVRTPNRFRGR